MPVNPLGVVDTAARGENIHRAIQDANLGLMTPPGDFSIEPISEIHEYGMLALLKTGYGRAVSEENRPYALPHTFNNFGFRTHKPRSIMGAMGHYCFDNTAPLLAHTWEAAYWAAQTAVSAAAFVAAGENQLAYALCRPPGHHAGPNFYGGFCYPLPRGTHEPAYLQALKHALDRIRRFVPDTLFISLGLDTFDGDLLGTFHLQTESFFNIGQYIADVGRAIAYSIKIVLFATNFHELTRIIFKIRANSC